MIGRNSLLDQRSRVVTHRHGREPDRATRGVRDLGDRFGERQEAGSGDLVDLTGVTAFGERGDRDVGDVVGVDERLDHRVDRQCDLAAQHRGQQVVLAEVLIEPARAHDRPRRAGLLHAPARRATRLPRRARTRGRAARRRGRPRAGRRRPRSRPHRARRRRARPSRRRRRRLRAPRPTSPGRPSRRAARRCETRSGSGRGASAAAAPPGDRSCRCRRARGSGGRTVGLSFMTVPPVVVSLRCNVTLLRYHVNRGPPQGARRRHPDRAPRRRRAADRRARPRRGVRACRRGGDRHDDAAPSTASSGRRRGSSRPSQRACSTC